MVMHTLAMPRLGETMEEGRIVRWLKSAGEAFERGEAILEVETDKTVAEFPALRSGTLVEILRGEDETVSVGEAIARIEVEGGGDESPEDATVGAAARPEDSTREKPASRRSPAPALQTGKRRATPVARRIARQNGLDIASIAGTGRRGRIEKHDVLAALEENSTGLESPDSDADLSFVEIGGGRMAYGVQGPEKGAAVLLVHGFAADRSVWAATSAALARDGHRVVACDLPGHGATTAEAANVADLGAALTAFVEAAAVGGRCHVVAHSLGVAAAVALAEARPEHVARLTLVAPAGLGLEIDATFIRCMASAGAPGEVAHLLRRISARGAGLSQQAYADIARQMSRGRLKALADDMVGPSGQRFDVLPALERLAKRMPVHVVVGLQDRIIPWQQATALPPAVSVHFMANSGHMPQWDQARDFVDLVRSMDGGEQR